MIGTKHLLKSLNHVGKVLLFVFELFKVLLREPIPNYMWLDQTWLIFKRSLLTTSVSGFFTGAIMTIQFSLLLAPFGALGYLGGLSVSATMRELGPLLIAFMLSGKVGAYSTAEIGTMKISDQLNAIRCLGADPVREILLPRFLGIVSASLLLLVFGLVLAFAGGMFTAYLFSSIDPQEYIRHVVSLVTMTSIIGGIVKCLCFSFILASICIYVGYHAEGGSVGVGRAVVQTAVAVMVTIVIADWWTSFMFERISLLFFSASLGLLETWSTLC